MELNEKSYKYIETINKDSLEAHISSILPEKSVILKNDNYFVKQFIEFSSIENDIEFVKLSVEKLIDYKRIDFENYQDSIEYKDINFINKRSLYISAIICYDRCFNKSKGRLNLNFDFLKKYIFEEEKKEILRKFHIKLRDLRNKFIAHSENYHLEETIAFLQFEMNDKTLNGRMNYLYSGTYSFSENELELFNEILSYMLEAISEKKATLAGQIVANISKEEYIKMGMQAIMK